MKEVVEDKKVVSRQEYIKVSIDKLVLSRRNPRGKSGIPVNVDDLTASVKEHGILTPLIVRPVGNDGRYEILAGSRRFAASQAAGLKEVPCRVFEVENDEALEIVVVENLQREGIHPLEEAEAFKEILDVSNGDVNGLCNKVGKKLPFITKRLSLLKLCEKGRKMFLAGKMSEGQAMLVSRLQQKDQKALVDRQDFERMSVRALQSFIVSEVMMELSTACFDRSKCETCPSRTGSSKDLFDDIKGGDRCVDQACFSKMTDEHIEKTSAALCAKGEKVFKIHSGYVHTPVKGALKKWAPVENVKELCEHGGKGIYVDGSNPGKVINLCSSPDTCKVHSHGRYQTSPQEKEKRKKERLGFRIEDETRKRVFHEILVKQKDVSVDDLKNVASTLFDRLWHNAAVKFAKVCGIAPAKTKWGGIDLNPVHKHVKEMKSLGDVSSFLIGLVCAADLDPRSDGKVMARHATRLSIPWSQIEKQVKADLQKPKKTVAKKTSKKEKAKA